MASMWGLECRSPTRAQKPKWGEENNSGSKVTMEAWHGMREHQYGEEDGTIGLFNSEQFIEVCIE